MSFYNYYYKFRSKSIFNSLDNIMLENAIFVKFHRFIFNITYIFLRYYRICLDYKFIILRPWSEAGIMVTWLQRPSRSIPGKLGVLQSECTSECTSTRSVKTVLERLLLFSPLTSNDDITMQYYITMSTVK